MPLNYLTSVQSICNIRTPAAQTYVLDSLSTSAKTALRGAYAIRRLATVYTGPTFNIRRSSDNTTLDFYANSNGSQWGTSADAGGTSLTTWLGGGTAYVAKWYDQSGVANDAVQTTTTLQPIFNPSSKYMDFKTGRYFTLPDSTLPTGNNSYSVTIHHNTVSSSANGSTIVPSMLTAGTQSNGLANLFTRYSTTTYRQAWWGTLVDSACYADNSIMSWIYNGSNLTVYKNGSQFSSTSVSSHNVGSGNNRIGSWYGTTNYDMNGELYNILIYSAVVNSTDRAIGETV